ncbi:MAG: putative Ig domain-containing protein, partial [Planctomycetota bacterium]
MSKRNRKRKFWNFFDSSDSKFEIGSKLEIHGATELEPRILLDGSIDCPIDPDSIDVDQFSDSEFGEIRSLMTEATVETAFFADFEDVTVAPGEFDLFQNVSGFTATRAPIEIQNNHPAVGPAAGGNQMLELDGENGVFVDIDSSGGGSFTLTFDYSPRPGVDSLQNTVEVWWNNELVDTASGDGTRLDTTEFRRVTITLDSTGLDTTRLELRSSSPSDNIGLGGLVDNVRVERDLAPLLLNEIADQDAQVGSTVSVNASVQDNGASTDGLFYSINAGPQGIQIDSNTGAITWLASQENIDDSNSNNVRTVRGDRELVFQSSFEDVGVETGSFDFFTSLSGFSAFGRGVEVQDNVASVGGSSDGSQHVELDGLNRIFRDIETNDQDEFELILDYSARPRVDLAGNTIEVWWDGVQIDTLAADGTSLSSTEFNEFRISLPGFSSDLTRLELRSNDPIDNVGLGGLIDNVRLYRTPVMEMQGLDNKFEVLVQVENATGQIDTETFTICVAGSITLVENDRFETTQQQTFSVLEGQALQITFEDPVFDLSDTDFHNDAFEIALVDSDGNPLVRNFSPGRDAFFNWTEESSPSFREGIELDGNVLTIGLNGIPQGTEATLIFRLVNNDSDETTSVTINRIDMVDSGLRAALPQSVDLAADLMRESSEAGVFEQTQESELENAPDGIAFSQNQNAEAGEATLNIQAQAPTDKFDVGTSVVLSGQVFVDAATASGVTFEYVTVNGTPVQQFDVTGRFFTLANILPGQNSFEFIGHATDGRIVSTEIQIIGTQTPDFNEFIDITASLEDVYEISSFDQKNDTLFVDLGLANEGSFPVGIPLLVGIRNISDPSVRVLGVDGLTPDGTPYIDFSERLSDQRLDPEEVSELPTIAFSNPNGIRFNYDLVFFGRLNEPPYFTSVPVLEAYFDEQYEYDVEADDINGDELTFSLLSAPAGMEIDTTTGQITWTPTSDDFGTHNVTVLVSDGRGGEAQQIFTITAEPAPPNRPPVITSEPDTFAFVATEFVEEDAQIDVRDWEQLFLDTDDQGGSFGLNPPVWDFAPDGLSVTQQVNAFPSILLSDFEVENEVIEGGFRVDGGDDDFVGFVFGFQNINQFYLFDWKQANQNQARRGMSVKVVDVAPPYLSDEFWDANGNGDRVSVIFDNDLAWQNGVDYRYRLEFQSGEFRIQVFEIDAESGDASQIADIFLQDDTYSSGRFGFYNFSQGGVNYSGFTRQDIAQPSYSYQVEAFDADQDDLIYELVDAPEGMTIRSDSGLILWNPSKEQLGNHEVVVRVTDGKGGLAEQTFIVCVHPDPENHAPVIVSTPITELTVGEEPEFSPIELTPTSLGSDFEDVFSVLPTEDPALFGLDGRDVRRVNFDVDENGNPIADGTVLTTEYASLGISFVNVRTDADVFQGPASAPNATDTSSSSQFVFSVPVVAVGVINTSPDQDLIEFFSPDGELIFSTRDQDGFPKDPTIDRFVGARSNRGQMIGSIRLGNNTGRLELDEFIFEVAPEGFGQYQYQIQATDSDNDELTYSIVSGPEGLSVDGETGLVSWFPTNEQIEIGTFEVSVEVADSRGGTDHQTFTIRVNEIGTGQITGTIFADDNNNQLLDDGETGVANVVTYLDQNQNGILDAGEITAESNTNGVYTFKNLADRTYFVKVATR